MGKKKFRRRLVRPGLPPISFPIIPPDWTIPPKGTPPLDPILVGPGPSVLPIAEDCVYDHATGTRECYGRKNQPARWYDRYGSNSCYYAGQDYPGIPGVREEVEKLDFGSAYVYEIDVTFLHQVIDVCNGGKVERSKLNRIKCEKRVSKVDFPIDIGD